MTNLKRAQWMLAIVAFGLLVSAITVWPAVAELKWAVRVVWGDAEPAGTLHRFVLQVIEALEAVEADYPFLLYAHDWLAFAHIVLAILFAGAIRDPVRNVWIVQCGLIMCLLVPVLAAICVPIRGLPPVWFWIDAAFAPAAGLPLWIAWRDIRRAELEKRTGWPRAVTRPRLPQTRTCAINAFGSSGYPFATRRYTEWTARR